MLQEIKDYQKPEVIEVLNEYCPSDNGVFAE